MVYIGFRRVDIEKDKVHGYSFYYNEPIDPQSGEGFANGKDFVSDSFTEVQNCLIAAVRAGVEVRVERNRFGKVVGIF